MTRHILILMKNATTKTVSIHTAIAYGLKNADASLKGDDRNAFACYFAANKYPQLNAELQAKGDEYSRKHAGL